MREVNNAAIAEACDKVYHRSCELPLGHHHGAPWLFSQAMRAFDHPACLSVTYEVRLNLVGPAFATIFRDGRLVMHRDPECPVLN